MPGPPLTVFCEIEIKKLRSRVCLEPSLLLEPFQKRQNEKCSKILEPGGGEAFLVDFGMSKKSSKNTGKLDKKMGFRPYRDSFEAFFRFEPRRKTL